jgi:hypothetical protein
MSDNEDYSGGSAMEDDAASAAPPEAEPIEYERTGGARAADVLP